jgi:hypothetical protein
VSCSGFGSYDQQRLAKKRYKKKLANQFKTRFIALWEKYGEFQEVNGKRCFAGYRIDGDGEGQKRMSWLLKQPKLYEDADDKHFDWTKLYFNLSKLQTVTDDDVAAFFEHYKQEAHTHTTDKLHYKLEKVTTPDDYGYYTTDHVVTEHWFEKKIVTVTQDENGNDVETITWEVVEGDAFLEELSWEIAYLALDSAEWFDNDTLTEITEIVHDEELDAAALDAKIDALGQTDSVADLYGIGTVYVVPTINDKIKEYTIEQSVGENILDDLEYVNYWGDDGQYYLSVEDAKRMRGEVFMELVTKTMDFRSKLKSKYKWRKRLLALAAIVAAGVALAFGQPHIAASVMLGYIGSVSNSATIKAITQIVSVAMGGASGGLSSLSATEALNLILNIGALYFAMQADNSASLPKEEDEDAIQHTFYQMPYTLYDDIYCFDDLIEISVEL